MRNLLCLLCFFVSIYSKPSCTGSDCAYFASRNLLVQQELSTHYDATVQLTPKEKRVDSLMASIRKYEINASIPLLGEFVLGHNFRDVKSYIDSTRTFQLIQSMPKGGLLHTHAIGDAWYLLKRATYDPQCWINVGEKSNDVLQYGFYFSDSTPPFSPGVKWKRVSDWRSEYSDPDNFDKTVLFPLLQYYTPPLTVTQDDMWVYFDTVIFRGGSLASKESIWRDWIVDGLKRLVEDGVTHLEIRGFMEYIIQPGTFSPKYNITQMTYIWKDILEEFNSNLPEIQQISLRFIVVVPRFVSTAVLLDALRTTIQMQENPEISKFIVGFDIVDEEDRYYPIVHYIDAWLYISKYLASLGKPPMKYYFHTAETTWYKRESSNIFDALLLNTTRIGHGFAIHNYPIMEKKIRDRGIGIEVCPLSNQLLRLVNDLRTHPARDMLSNGLAVTISSDDAVIYGYNGVSYDFWAAYTSWNLTLAGVKKLAQNSIQYSSLTSEEKVEKLSYFNTAWNTWIDNVLSNY